MDHFGIGSAINGAVETYLRASRGTGRTTSLIDSVKDGDCVVFVDVKQAKRFEMLCKEREVNVSWRVCDPHRVEGLFQHGSVSGDGRLLFDHVWVEDYYRAAIQQAAADIDRLQRELSGHGEPHRENKRAAHERRRWVL